MPYRATKMRLPALVVFVALCGLIGTTLMPPSARASPIALGVNTEEITSNTAASLESFSKLSGTTPDIAMWYQDWTESWSTALLNPKLTGPARAQGMIPMVTWMPELDTGNAVNQPAYALSVIAGGRYDSYIRRAALEAAAYQLPVFVRLAPEMNGSWSPWGAGINGNTSAAYIAMWRHVVSIFRASGATNVKWVWSPNVLCNGKCSFASYYPGDAWVSWIGLDGYNYASVDHVAWMSFSQVFEQSYRVITSMTSKPLMIAETASTELGGNKSAWIASIPEAISVTMPRIRALVWFDRNKEADWRINSSSSSLEAFRGIASSGFFSRPLSWLEDLSG